jgi:hypothetical protein
MTTIEVVHLVQVEDDDRTYGLGSRPVCSCGWVGHWQDSFDDAADAGAEHRDGEVGPPDAVDACLSGLLDLQDDIAQVVIWLAENWSADLPAPHWYTGGAYYDDRNVVRVLVYCDDADELARASAVLGAVAVDDATPNSEGDRYRRAERSFGRATVSAYRLIEAAPS